MSTIPRRLLGVFVALVGVGMTSCDTSTAPDPLYTRPFFSAMGDTVPCPANPYGWTVCTIPESTELSTLVAEAQRITLGASGQCHAAGEAILGALGGDVLIHHHSSPGAEVSWDPSSGPPYTPVRLVVADYLLWSAHVAEGNTLNMLYHEGAHLIGIAPGDEGAVQGFADNCVALHVEEEVVEEPSSGGSGGGGGGECTEANPCDDPPTSCWVRYWYWMDTGQIIHYEVLYCF